MEILDLIRAQCRVQGVSDKYAEHIEKITGITEEKDGNIVAAVKNFKENIIPEIQSAKNSVEEARKKAIEEYEKAHNLKDGKPIKPAEPPKPITSPDSVLSPEVQAVLDANKKQIEELTNLVAGVVKKQTASVKIEEVKGKMKGKIDDSMIERYAKRVNLEADDLDAEIEAVVAEFNEDKQTFLNDAVSRGDYRPVEGFKGSSDADIDKYIELKSKPQNSDGFVGIEI